MIFHSKFRPKSVQAVQGLYQGLYQTKVFFSQRFVSVQGVYQTKQTKVCIRQRFFSVKGLYRFKVCIRQSRPRFVSDKGFFQSKVCIGSRFKSVQGLNHYKVFIIPRFVSDQGWISQRYVWFKVFISHTFFSFWDLYTSEVCLVQYLFKITTLLKTRKPEKNLTFNINIFHLNILLF